MLLHHILLLWQLYQYILKYYQKGLLSIIVLLIILYFITTIASYLQTRLMGQLSQRTLFKLRQNLFAKIQSLPIAFFNQNKTGDLISRLNNDTDKLNQFLSESLIRFVSIFFSLIGIAVFVFVINFKMALILLLSTTIIFLANYFMSNWVEKLNKESLTTTGLFSAQINESMTNYKAIVAFNKQLYLKNKLSELNEKNYQDAIKAQIASGLFKPIYDFADNIAQVIVLLFGIYLISRNELTIGLLIGFVGYTQKFYEPLRIMGTIWGSLQSAVAAWIRIREIFLLQNNLKILKKN